LEEKILNQIDDDLKIHFSLIFIGFNHRFCYFGSTRSSGEPFKLLQQQNRA